MKLFILNDDVNSFEHVISCIQRYLNYPYLQSVSIADIVHNSGKCEVKDSDDEEMIKILYQSMVKEGLHLRIEG
jgi:ATP-dependent Clp protease adaptor protein ClpS